MAKAKAEMALSKYPKGFDVTLLTGAGARSRRRRGRSPEPAGPARLKVTFKQEDTSTEFNDIGKQNYRWVQLLDDGTSPTRMSS